MLAFLDLETTGLDPDTSVILEVGIVLTEDNLEEIARASWVIHAQVAQQIAIYAPGSTACVDERVVQMHHANGLWKESAESTDSRAIVRESIAAWLCDHNVIRGQVPLAGNTIGFDRMFLREYMPEINAHFHYRSIDISSLNELARRWAPALYAARPNGIVAHRALDDLDVSIATARYYRGTLFEGLTR